MRLRTSHKLIRLFVRVISLLGICYGGLVGFSLYERWGNPHRPHRNWPALRSATSATAEELRIVVDDNVQVVPFQPGVEYWECELAAHPTNPNLLFATSLVITPETTGGGANTRALDACGYYSHDGAKTWRQGFYLSANKVVDPEKRESYFDPSVCFGTGDSVHFVVMFGNNWGAKPILDITGEMFAPTSTNRSLVFYRSSDNGETWAKRATLHREVDRPFLIVDGAKGADPGKLYTIGNVAEVIVIRDNELAAEIGPGAIMEGQFKQVRPANPVQLRDGTMLFAAEDFAPIWRGRIRPDSARKIYTFRCSDGERFEPGPLVNTRWSHASLQNSVRPSTTFFPRLGANPRASAFIDHVYCVWAGGRDDGECIFVSVSRDGGQSWTTPVVVSEQPLEANHRQEYLTVLPSVAVNQNGIVAISWYDRRGLRKSDPADEGNGVVTGWNVRARLSQDGGASWLPSVQLNSTSSRAEFDVGHTAGLVATADGKFHALWIDARDGTRQLWTTSFGLRKVD